MDDEDEQARPRSKRDKANEEEGGDEQWSPEYLDPLAQIYKDYCALCHYGAKYHQVKMDDRPRIVRNFLFLGDLPPEEVGSVQKLVTSLYKLYEKQLRKITKWKTVVNGRVGVVPGPKWKLESVSAHVLGEHGFTAAKRDWFYQRTSDQLIRDMMRYRVYKKVGKRIIVDDKAAATVLKHCASQLRPKPKTGAMTH